MQEKAVVLYVDDEISSLSGFQKSFRREFEIFTAETAEEGRNILSQHPVQIVLTDQRMPEETGVDFLVSIKDRYPHIIKILITGFAEIEAVIDAVNQGDIFRYISKPYSKEILLKTLNEAFALYCFERDARLELVDLRSAFDELKSASFLVSDDFKLLRANPAFLKLVKLPGNELMMADIRDVLDGFSKYCMDVPFELEDIPIELENEGIIDNYLLSFSRQTSNNSPGAWQGIMTKVTTVKEQTRLQVEEMLSALDVERKEIATQLHESVAQQLAGIHFYLSAISGNANLDLTKAAGVLQKSSVTLENTINELRQVCFDLIPEALSYESAETVIGELVYRFNSKRKDWISAQVNVSPSSLVMSANVYRFVKDFVDVFFDFDVAKVVLLLNENDRMWNINFKTTVSDSKLLQNEIIKKGLVSKIKLLRGNYHSQILPDNQLEVLLTIKL